MTNKKAVPKKTKKSKKPEIVIDNTKLQLQLKWAGIKQEYDRVLAQLAKKVKAKGFRPGKVPLKIAQEKIGQEHLVNQVLENLVSDKYQALIKKEGKEPLTKPEIKPLKMEWGQDWELEVQIAEKPTIKLGDYHQVIKQGLKTAHQQLKTEKEGKSSAAKKADSKKKSSQTKQEEKETKEEKHARIKQIRLHQVCKALVEKIQPQIPELLLKEGTQHEIQRLTQELERIGLALDDYLAQRKQKFEEMFIQIAAQTLSKLQLEFILEALEKAEKIKVSDQDKQAKLGKIQDKKVRQQIEEHPHYLNQLERQIKRQKLFDLLTSFA